MRRALLFFLLPFFCFGREAAPWYGTSLELYPYASYLLQEYGEVDTVDGSVPRGTVDHFLTLGIYSFYDVYAAEVETVFSETRENPFGFDSFILTARYKWMDDIIGDLMSVVVGASYIQTVSERRDDISSFHHGNVEGEFHLAFGRECACGASWWSRGWGLVAIGVATRGSPWLRGRIQADYNRCDRHQFSLLVNGLMGLGDEKLDLNLPFRGYGAIQHRSVDLGVQYRFDSVGFGIATLEYRRRLLARNFPENANLLQLTYTYPFGL